MALTFVQYFALFLALIFNFSDAKIFSPCELAQTVAKTIGSSPTSIGQWVCLAKFTSGFKSDAVNGPFPDGSFTYGIFHIPDKYCRSKGSSNCGVSSCNDLHGHDIGPSFKCALKIFGKEKFNAWPEWKNDCDGRDVSQYVKKCPFKANLRSLFNPEITLEA